VQAGGEVRRDVLKLLLQGCHSAGDDRPFVVDGRAGEIVRKTPNLMLQGCDLVPGRHAVEVGADACQVAPHRLESGRGQIRLRNALAEVRDIAAQRGQSFEENRERRRFPRLERPTLGRVESVLDGAEGRR
jgi:hypothetical protein